jgi:hypothetical protein
MYERYNLLYELRNFNVFLVLDDEGNLQLPIKRGVGDSQTVKGKMYENVPLFFLAIKTLYNQSHNYYVPTYCLLVHLLLLRI